MAARKLTPGNDLATFCLGCGYMLRDLSANRCPECGRAFDPNDPRTMSIGRPLRGWQRKLVKPIGWPVVLLAVLGTAGMLYLSDKPHLQIEPWQVFRDELRWPTEIPRPFTKPDWVFFASACFWAVFLALFVTRHVARLLVPRIARRALHPGATVRRRNALVAFSLIATVFYTVFGWQQRVGRRWMARVVTDTTPTSTWWLYDEPDATGKPLFRFSAAQGESVLKNLIADLPTPTERQEALRVLVETSGRQALPAFIRSTERENDIPLLCTKLHLIGLCREPSTASFLIPYLQDSRPDVRAAAADAVGILRHPSYSVLLSGEWWITTRLSLDTARPISLTNVVAQTQHAEGTGKSPLDDHDLNNGPVIPIDGSVRDTLQRMMTGGVAAQEREAAARALVTWPPANYKLRVAEWGVWISDQGRFALTQSIIDEIPPFVHQTGNPTDSFENYFRYPSAVTKPVVHLTSDVTLAADVEVHISDGRPWFAFPLPDDFAVEDGYGAPFKKGMLATVGGDNQRSQGISHKSDADDFRTPAIKQLSDCREGYPWLIPHHRLHYAGGLGYSFGSLYNLGLRWQSLIISPTQLPWMTPPTVPADPKFAWWARLRQVPSSWLANRGEAERFLYYDGPTRSEIPMAVSLDGTQLRFAAEAVEKGDNSAEGSKPRVQNQFEPMAARATPGLPEYEGMYIDCRAEGLSAIHMVVDAKTTADVTGELPLKGEAVIQRFRQMLLSYGLTPGEAEGLVAAWTPQFFHTPGRRFVLRMSPADYARQCPMQVRPTPTQVVRLGLILTEFDAKPVAARQPQKE